MELDKELYKEIKEYCDLNGLKTRDYVHNLLRKAFMEDKYGTAPFANFTKKIVEGVEDGEKQQNETIKKIEDVTKEPFEPIDTGELVFVSEPSAETQYVELKEDKPVKKTRKLNVK